LQVSHWHPSVEAEPVARPAPLMGIQHHRLCQLGIRNRGMWLAIFRPLELHGTVGCLGRLDSGRKTDGSHAFTTCGLAEKRKMDETEKKGTRVKGQMGTIVSDAVD
jgi:hypothetical protein